MENKKVRILTVDDDEMIRGTFAEALRQEGFDVDEAVDGLEGLDKATKKIPDAIITGIIMPRMDGFGFIEALKKNVATANIPIIMFSHMGREEDRKKAQDLGINEFIIKGMISPKEMAKKVRSIFGSSEYKIKFSASELDAPKLAQDFNINQEFKCPKCSGEMILNLKSPDVNKKEFTAKIICLKCG